jgi:hypothetical protein
MIDDGSWQLPVSGDFSGRFYLKRKAQPDSRFYQLYDKVCVYREDILL